MSWFVQALERFSTEAADTENDAAKESIFDEKVGGVISRAEKICE